MNNQHPLTPDSHIEEATLILMLKNGDSKGFEYLYEHYAKSLFKEIRNIISDYDIAADVLQEVFINVHKKINYYDSSKGKLYTWIVTMTRNLTIDTCLSKGYRNYQQNTYLSKAEENPSPGTATQIDNIGLRDEVKKIKAIYWEVLYLKYFQGHTYEEISVALKMPLGTVKTRIKAGLVQLRKMMSEEVW